MSKLIGNYAHVKNEQVEEYFRALGVPYVARKMIAFASPSLIIKLDGDDWTISTATAFRTNEIKFKLGEEYTEDMPKGQMKCVTTLEDDILKIDSIGPEDIKIVRLYKPTNDGCVLIMKNEVNGIEAKRYFKRV